MKHVKMLNITGGIAIGALALAGFLLISDVFETSADPKMSEAAMASIADEKNSTDQKELVSFTSNSNEDDVPAAPEIKTPVQAVPDKPGNREVAKAAITFEEELQSFEASCNDGAIAFHWITLGGAKYAYEIEKTYDQVNYEVFSRAPQPEKKDGKNIYAVEEAINSDEEAFYRLRKVMGRNKFEYSETVKVKCTGKDAYPTAVDVFPNGNGSFRIIINTAKEGTYKVSLADVNNTQLANEEFQAKQGNNEFILSSSSITKGNYLLRVSNDFMVKEKKVVLK